MPDSVGNIGSSGSTISTTVSTAGDLEITGTLTLSGGNLTGTDAALLGANAPPLDNPLTPKGWLTVIDDDGDECVFPVWKKA